MGIFFEKAEKSNYKVFTIVKITFSLAALVIISIGIINNLNTIYLGFAFLLLALTSLMDGLEVIINKQPKKRLYYNLIIFASFTFISILYFTRY